MTQASTTILITGGAGFIGSTLVRQYLEQEATQVVNLDFFTYAGHRKSLEEIAEHPRYQTIEGDILNARLVNDTLQRKRPVAVIHLAAESHVDRSISQPSKFASTNVLGTCTLLEETTRYWRTLDSASRAAFRFLYVSTDEVFGSADTGEVFHEWSPLAPNSPYAASKAAGEQMTRAFGQTYGLPYLIANPTNNYGPRQHPEKLIPLMILNAAAGKPLPIYGDGQQQRDWLHVEDGCRALRAILSSGSPGERYLIGTETCQANLPVVEGICKLVDRALGGSSRKALISHVTDRLGHDRRYAVSAARLREATGWKPEISFSEGLERTVQWYLSNPAWVAAMSG